MFFRSQNNNAESLRNGSTFRMAVIDVDARIAASIDIAGARDYSKRGAPAILETRGGGSRKSRRVLEGENVVRFLSQIFATRKGFTSAREFDAACGLRV